MQFGITIPLQNFLGEIKPPYGEPEDLFFCWELHVITFQGRSTLIAANASNCFTIVLWGMGEADWKEYPELVVKGIKDALAEEGYTGEQIQEYIRRGGEIRITKTHGRRPVAGLNRMIEYLNRIPVKANPELLYQRFLSLLVNRENCRPAGFDKYGCAADFLYEDMKRLEQKE